MINVLHVVIEKPGIRIFTLAHWHIYTLSDWFYKVQRLIVFNRRCIIYQYFYHFTTYLTFNFVKQFHGFNNADYLAWRNFITYFNKQWFVRGRPAIECTNHRAFYGDKVGRSGGFCGRFCFFRRRCTGCGGWRLLRYRLWSIYRSCGQYLLYGFLLLFDGYFKSFFLYRDFSDIGFVYQTNEFLYLLEIHMLNFFSS